VVVEDFSDCFGECPTESDESSEEEPADGGRAGATRRVSSDVRPQARRTTADGATNSNSFR